MNQTDHMRFVEFLKCILECSPCSLSGKALSPILSGKRPSNFKSGPADRVEKTDTTHEVTCCFLFNGKVSIAAHVPVSDVKCEVAPGFEAIEGFTAEIPHDLRIRTHFRERFKIRLLTPHSEEETICFKVHFAQCS